MYYTNELKRRRACAPVNEPFELCASGIAIGSRSNVSDTLKFDKNMNLDTAESDETSFTLRHKHACESDKPAEQTEI